MKYGNKSSMTKCFYNSCHLIKEKKIETSTSECERNSLFLIWIIHQEVVEKSFVARQIFSFIWNGMLVFAFILSMLF